MMPKWVKNVDLNYMDTDNYYPLRETGDLYKDSSEYVEKWSDVSNCDEKRRKRPLSAGKNKNVIGLMKDKKSEKIIKKFAAAVSKSYSYMVQKDDHEKEDLEFIRTIGVKKLPSKDLRFSDYEKCVFDSKNAPITKEQVSFRNIKYVIYTITNNKIALCKVNDKKVTDEDGISTYLFGSNISFIKHFHDKHVLRIK